MKRALLPVLPVLVLATACSGIGLGAPPPGGSGYEDEPWVLRSVSADGRVLHVQGRGGGCGTEARATATETAETVTLSVQQRLAVNPSGGCPAIGRLDELRVRLSAPIGGRALIGQSLQEARIDLSERPKVPRIVGLRAADAAFALRAQGFRVAGIQEGTVGGQSPAPRTPAQLGRTIVTLASTPAALPPLRPVTFHTVAKGGIASSFTPRTAFLVRSERRWRALWRQLDAGGLQSPRPPRVNFARDMLLVVTQGTRPEGTDHVVITNIGDTGPSLEVSVDEYTSSADCAPTDVNQEPFRVVRLRRGPERVHVVRFHQPAPCGPTRESRGPARAAHSG